VNVLPWMLIALVLSLGGPSRGGPDPALTCDLPILWQLGEVDGRFGLDRDEVEEAIRRATYLWEDASRRILFRSSPDAGLVVNLRFSPTQQLPLALEPGADAHRLYLDPLDRWRSNLAVLRIDLEQRMEIHIGRTESLDRRLASHNRQVESWNERGGAPADVVARLEELGAQFAQERTALNDSVRALNQAQASWSEETRQREEAVAAYNQALEGGQAPDPQRPAPARWSPRSAADRSGEGQIEIHRFAGWVDFTALVAQALGQVLGLGPTEDPGSLLNPQTLALPVTAGVPPVRPRDLERLRELCPLP